MEQKQTDKLTQARVYLNQALIIVQQVTEKANNDFANISSVINREKTDDEDPKAQAYDSAESELSNLKNLLSCTKSALSLLNRLI